ncbi:thiamine pyrophosphate enzyme [Xylariales sp. PMI_506]|nr:thiamine pyrophosphate enzyme [Xylariales sp. PMI_506]
MGSYTTATAILEALESAGVTHLFVNLGSDHPAILEAIAKRKQDDTRGLQILTAPNEFVGLCAAQGFFQASGKMQAVLVHVDAGTLALAGAIHNVSRARIPVIILAGTSPITEEGELAGTRNEFIHYLQDTVDQRNIVKGYTVLNHEIRTGRNAKQLILRAAQFSQSEPQGPSYLIASRETFEERLEPYNVDARKWKPVAAKALSPDSIEQIGNALLNAKFPVIITTYLGRVVEAVPELISLAETTGTAVLVRALPGYLNFPHDHKLYVGNHWSEGLKDGVLDEADVVIVVDCDVPWIKSVFKPSTSAVIYHIDSDPLKVNMSLFHIDAELVCQADARVALQQLNQFLSQQDISAQKATIDQRIEKISGIHDAYVDSFKSKEVTPASDEIITPHYALSRLREHIDQDTIVLSEGISNYRPICDVLQRTLPGTYFTSGATALGWSGGAAIGAKLAHPGPDRTVVSICGDGSFLFSIPSTVHWMARRYDAPFLTVILNNRGWKSPMLSALALHGQEGHVGRAASADDLHVTFDPPVDHSAVAVAAGAGFGVAVRRASELDAALARGLETVRGGRAAVIDVWLPKFQVGDRVG